MSTEREILAYSLPLGDVPAAAPFEERLRPKGPGCPLTADLFLLAEGQAAPDVAGPLEQHLEGCQACRDSFQRFGRALAEEDPGAAEPSRTNDAPLGRVASAGGLPGNPRKRCLLVVDDEAYLLPTLSALVADTFEVLTADSAEDAQRVFAAREVDLILTDQRMPRRTGTQLLEWVRQHSPKTVRLLMTGYAELEDAVEAINRGQVYHYLPKPWRTEELLVILRNAAEKFDLERNREHLHAELHQLNRQLEERVARRTRELQEANHLLQQRTRELELLALTDPLTSLLNRRAIDDVARSELRRHTRYQSPLALGVIDADFFREINHRYLHPGGDAVLVGLARTLSSSLRTVDSVGRIGGEEFLVVAPETNQEGAMYLAERIRTMVERSRTTYKDQEIEVTVSIGFAVVEGKHDTEYDQLKHVAAAALSEAKARGRNRSVLRTLA